MLSNLTKLIVIVLVFGVIVIQAQDNKTKQVFETKAITGEEIVDLSSNPVVEKSATTVFGPVSAGGVTFDIHNITDVATGYDLQSNGSTQQVWLRPDMPDFIHAAFTNSQVADGSWADRTSLYFGSTDFGATWFELGGVPINTGTSGRSGFPTIQGTSTGAAIISNHNNADQTATIATVFIDNGPFEYNFTNHSPGAPAAGATIWPRLAVTSADDVVLAASINGGTDLYINTLSAGTFSGWQLHNGDQAETYNFSVSDAGTIGLAYLGQTSAGQDYDVFYKESTDGGLTWSAPVTVWDATPDPLGDIFGCIRGVSVNFYGEEPCVVFECGWNTATGYYPGLPSEIRFWSPSINGGASKVLADSNSVPYWQNYGVADVQYPMGRPVIGRSQTLDHLFVGFNATTGDYWPGIGATDSTAYMAGYFMYSADGGETWSAPERFTPYPPAAPLKDWRYVSIAPISPVAPADDDNITIHFVMQGDSIPGSTVNAVPPMPVGVTAQYYHFSGDLLVVNANDPIVVNEFNLEQNYPNPFNPSTSINYSLAEASDVSLKVFDILGREVATLVNSTQNAGSYNVNFDASNLASGLYVYTLKTGNFVSSKKMMLLK